MLDHVIANLLDDELVLGPLGSSEAFLEGCIVLNCHHDGVDAAGRAVLVLHGDLALAVRAHPRYLARALDDVQTAGQTLGQCSGNREVAAAQFLVLLGLFTGVAEHHTLVARAVAVDTLADVL